MAHGNNDLVDIVDENGNVVMTVLRSMAERHIEVFTNHKIKERDKD